MIAALAAGGYVWFRPANRDVRAATPPTIAVLAFQPADGSDNARLVANGLASSVASSLSRYDVTVIAASSSLQLTPAQKPRARRSGQPHGGLARDRRGAGLSPAAVRHVV